MEYPTLPCKGRPCKRYDSGSSEVDRPGNVQDMYRRIFIEALDLIICGIQTRFDQPGYQVYCKLENLLKAANKENLDEELQFVTEFYGDLNIDQLRLYLDIMSQNLPKFNGRYTLQYVVVYLRDLTPIQRVLVSQVCTLVSLILVLPATNATSERSFSTLRRIKTFLRSTMTQVRLNNAMLLHIYSNMTESLNLIDIGNDFIFDSEHRLTLFGKFSCNE